MRLSKQDFEALYWRYNRRKYVHPDPLEFLYEYDSGQDREIVGLIASSLAYGRVAQILNSVSRVLRLMGPSPSAFLLNSSPRSMRRTFAGFRHRFTPGEELADMLSAARRVIEEYGSLGACFVAGLREDDETVLPALERFVEAMVQERNGTNGTNGTDGTHKSHRSYGSHRSHRSYLLPSPAGGSACKRLNLYLRWMVRHDEVDPGGWDAAATPKLIVPVDTHIHKIALALGLTSRKQADLRAAIEITGAFKSLAPDDPVRYDFALSRFGIRSDMNIGDLCNKAGALPTIQIRR